MKKVFTPDVITYLRQNKQEITRDLLDELQKTKEGKQIVFDILDLEKNEEGYYLDAFGKEISYQKIPTLKNRNRKLTLHPLHIEEIERCKNNIFYFMNNYVKIKTPKGINYPDLRHYQIDFLNNILPDEHESIVGLLPRQCCDASTVLNIGNKDITFEELFNECKSESPTLKKKVLKPTKFIESYPGNGRKIRTPKGYAEIIEVHKTIKYPKFKIFLKNGMHLEAAHNHVIIDANNNEVYVEDSLGKHIQTINGISEVEKVLDLGVKEHMYDISIDSEDEVYYSNGILSHNSGKSVIIGIYLCWLAIFEKDVNIGIAAQSHSMAKEFLTKVKDIFIELPIWLTPGVIAWNMTSISLENGVRVLSDTASSNSFRGHTISYSVTDEAAYITGRDNGTTKFSAYLDSMLPSQSSLVKKKNIFISTANGMNEFYTLYKGALKDGFEEVTEMLDADDIIYSDTVENHYKSDELEKPKEIISITPLKTSNLNEKKYKVHYQKRKIGSNGSLAFSTDWKRVPRWKPDGSCKTPEEFREEVIASKGEIFFQQAYGNTFIGSSYTLIDADRLKALESQEPIDIIDGKLKVYKKIEKDHQYVCTVDPAKDGIDGFTVNFIDITSFKLEQVATANLDIDYLLMPELLNEWCKYYSNPYLIIENNEGAGQSVADQMVLTYEYTNIHYDKNENIRNSVKARKKYPGFRTTKKTRNQILKTMKTFFDNGNLIIHDKDTINQLYTFILIDGKYQADQGAHDDCVMSLALAFSLFINIKNISDMTVVTEQLKKDTENKDPVNVAELLTVGEFDGNPVTQPGVYTDSRGITYEGFDDKFDNFNPFDTQIDPFDTQIDSFGDTYDISEFG